MESPHKTWKHSVCVCNKQSEINTFYDLSKRHTYTHLLQFSETDLLYVQCFI